MRPLARSLGVIIVLLLLVGGGLLVFRDTPGGNVAEGPTDGTETPTAAATEPTPFETEDVVPTEPALPTEASEPSTGEPTEPAVEPTEGEVASGEDGDGDGDGETGTDGDGDGETGEFGETDGNQTGQDGDGDGDGTGEGDSDGTGDDGDRDVALGEDNQDADPSGELPHTGGGIPLLGALLLIGAAALLRRR